ncbi:hypothetical protein DSUL_40094 [Desulfovibrionales bacterium]
MLARLSLVSTTDGLTTLKTSDIYMFLGRLNFDKTFIGIHAC